MRGRLETLQNRMHRHTLHPKCCHCTFSSLGSDMRLFPPHLSTWELNWAMNCGHQHGQLVGPSSRITDCQDITCSRLASSQVSFSWFTSGAIGADVDIRLCGGATGLWRGSQASRTLMVLLETRMGIFQVGAAISIDTYFGIIIYCDGLTNKSKILKYYKSPKGFI